MIPDRCECEDVLVSKLQLFVDVDYQNPLISTSPVRERIRTNWVAREGNSEQEHCHSSPTCHVTAEPVYYHVRWRLLAGSDCAEAEGRGASGCTPALLSLLSSRS